MTQQGHSLERALRAAVHEHVFNGKARRRSLLCCASDQMRKMTYSNKEANISSVFMFLF